MRVAIVGSRRFGVLDKVRTYVESLPEGTVVVSGGAKGVDKTAVETAAWHGHETKVWLPDYKTYGNAAPARRNLQIVQDSDRVVAFWDGESRGTLMTINIAKNLGKPVEVIYEV